MDVGLMWTNSVPETNPTVWRPGIDCLSIHAQTALHSWSDWTVSGLTKAVASTTCTTGVLLC